MMQGDNSFAAHLMERGLTRRGFLKSCAVLASLLALPPASASTLAQGLMLRRRQSIVWLSFQECTGCTESVTRSSAPSLEQLIFDYFSLDYHHTLQAAAGGAAEQAREATLREGGYLLVVEGSVPLALGGACSTIAGRSNLDLLAECAGSAQAIVALGSCAAHGGLPMAAPNPTGAVSVDWLMQDGRIAKRPLVNLPGCPPLPEALTAILAHLFAFGTLPALDALQRPLALYGNSIHDRCSRLHFFHEGKFARTFDDEGARKGWCLYELGCKGPVTHNACPTQKWNGISSPIDSGHPCIGCSEPGFWDAGPFYRPLLPAAAAPQPSPDADAAERGRTVYESNCVYCHDVDPGGLHTAPQDIPGILRDGGIRAHRFELDDQSMEDLARYLNEEKP